MFGDEFAGRRKQPESCYTCEDDWEIVHHVSYYPEETVKVCRSCHMKIHTVDGFHDDLDPGVKRPADFVAAHMKEKMEQGAYEVDVDLDFVPGEQYLDDLGVCDECNRLAPLAVSDGGQFCGDCIEGDELSYVLRAIHRGY